MEIKVTGCHDCPFADDEYGKCRAKKLKRKKSFMSIYKYLLSEKLHPSCPLKQQSITVKLESNGKEMVGYK